MADENLQQQAGGEAGATQEGNELDRLIQGEFRTRSQDQLDRVKDAFQTLATQALAQTNLISDDAIKSIESIIAEIDRKLSEQINAILHHEDFKALEGTWRGLHHLVSNTETDQMLKIRVLNISKKDVAKTLKKFQGAAWDQSPLFKKIYGEEFDTPGGHPYGALIGDYHFDHSAPDVEILKGMSQIAAASHAPFISAADPALLSMGSWQELSNPRDLAKVTSSSEYAAFRALRESDDAKYLALTMPRFLSRMPYGAKTNPVEEFSFEEITEAGNHKNYVWSNSAYAMGANITRAFKVDGWLARIRGVESGGMVGDLPCHTFPSDDGGVDMKCPTEIAIGDRREKELSDQGLIALCHWKNTNHAVFIGAQSLNKPVKYDDQTASENAELSARLPYLFTSCRFAHYLKCMVRDKIGSFKERVDMERWLNDWINQYVVADPNAAEEQKARYPLADAKVLVEEIPGNPGYYTSKFFLRPHYQLEGLTVSLRLVSKIKAPGGG